MYEKNKRYFAFNIWDFDSIKAVTDAAEKCNCDVILQTSSRVFEKMEHEAVRDYVNYLNKKTCVRTYLHLDHCRKMEVLFRAVDAGWDSIMIDASHLPLKENIDLTNKISKYAHSKGVLVEAEVGQIYGVEEDIETNLDSTANMNEIKRFLDETDIDMFAAAIGTSHGIYKNTPDIRFSMIEEIRSFSEKPFVVHGGSGLTDNVLIKLLSYQNVKKINISTELKQAYLRGLRNAESAGLMFAETFEVLAVKEKIFQQIFTVAVSKMRLLDRFYLGRCSDE